jgi:hypothetical protein
MILTVRRNKFAAAVILIEVMVAMAGTVIATFDYRTVHQVYEGRVKVF